MRLLVRISDNVLNPEDWSIFELEFSHSAKDGFVVASQTLKNQSRGTSREFCGMGVEDLSKWSFWDPTGHHPETYHEIFDEDWHDRVPASRIVEMLERQRTMMDRRFILWDTKDGAVRYDGDDIISDGVIGRVTINNAYLAAYAVYPDERRPKDLEVGQSISSLGFHLSGGHGWYDLYRVR